MAVPGYDDDLTGIGPDAIAAALAELQATAEYVGPLELFPWHPQQELALAAATDVTCILGGNQSGKTQSALGIVARLVRRSGPIYERLRNPVGRQLRIWVSPQLSEKYRSNWEARLIGQVFAGFRFVTGRPRHPREVRYVRSPEPVFEWMDEAGGGVLAGKSQEQGFLAFESDVVDLIVFDEEPQDKRLYTSAEQRLATTNGCLVFAFTPLSGMTWTYHVFYQPTVQPAFRLTDRAWRRGNAITVLEMGMADNPASVAGGGVRRLMENPGITEAEKQTRLFGKYGFTEGLIFPMFATLTTLDRDSIYLLDRLPDDRPYSWVFTCDPNKRHGGLLTAIDHEGNRYYCAEHYAESLPDRLHAARYLALMRQFGVCTCPTHQDDSCPADCLDGVIQPTVLIAADPGGAGAQAIINLSDLGVYAQRVPKDAGSVKASIELVRRAAWVDPRHRHPVTGVLGAPHTYFLRSLSTDWQHDGATYHESRLLWELRQYRQKPDAPPDTPIKERDDCTDCLRYLELVRPFAPIYEDKTLERARAKLDPLSRRAAQEFDDLVEKIQRGERAQQRGAIW